MLEYLRASTPYNLPVDILDEAGNTKIVNVVSPSPDQFKEFESIVDSYINAKEDLAGYFFDFNLELQKIFLKGLFQNDVKIRKPIDPKVKVISTEPEK